MALDDSNGSNDFDPERMKGQFRGVAVFFDREIKETDVAFINIKGIWGITGVQLIENPPRDWESKGYDDN